MKQMVNKFSILTIALICGLSMTACTTSEKSANDKNPAAGGTEKTGSTTDNKSAEIKKPAKQEVLYDFRKSDEKPQTFSKAETDAVVKYLFGETNSKIEISNRLQGAFTKPNAKETLYYLTGCKDETSGQFTTDCPHVSWNTEGWIALFDGTTPVLKINEALGSSVGEITDVNGDGKNEFLSFGGYGQSGIQTLGVSIGQISDGKYQNIKGFHGYADNCAIGDDSPADKKKAKAAVISYVSTTDGKMPDFSEEHFGATCKEDEADNSSWKKITKKEFDEFFDSLS